MFKDTTEAIRLNSVNLTEVHLFNINLNTKAMMQALVDALQQNTHVTYLDLSWNEMDNDVAEVLFKFLCEKNINCNIKELILTGNDINSSINLISKEIIATNFTQLQILQLDHTLLDLPTVEILGNAITCNNTLQVLSLSHNGLGDKAIKTLAINLYDNKTIQELHLSGNNITNIGMNNLVNMLNNNKAITKIWFNRNSITSSGFKNLLLLCRQFKNKTLCYIDFTCNALSDKEELSLQASFKHCKYITNVNCTDVTILTPEYEIKANLEAVAQNNITTLNLFNCDINADRMGIIINALNDNTNIINLNLSYCNINDDMALPFFQSLKNNNTLQKLNLDGNNIGADDITLYLKSSNKINTNKTLTTAEAESVKNGKAIFLIKKLKNSTSSLKVILIFKNANKIIYKNMAANVKLEAKFYHLAIKEKNSVFPSLGVIPLVDVSGEFTQKAITYARLKKKATILQSLGNAITLNENSILQCLSLNYNKISSINAYYFLKALLKNTSINTLNIGHNNISGIAIKALEALLLQNKILHNLDISGNSLSHDNAMIIARSLYRNNATLKKLDISRNNIGSIGMLHLAISVVNHIALKKLNISLNNINSTTLQKFINTISLLNNSLTYLNLSGNSIGGGNGSTALAVMLRLNDNIKYLDITDCDVDLTVLNDMELNKFNRSKLQGALSADDDISQEIIIASKEQKEREEKHRIEIDNIIVGKKLGESELRTTYLSTCKKFVIRKFKINFNDYEETCAETKILRAKWYNIDHPNIIKLYAHCDKQGHPSRIATEYMPGGSLHKLLKNLKQKGKSININQVFKYAIDVAKGLHHLHSMRLRHGALHANNILFDKKFQTAKITDFGFRNINMTTASKSTVRNNLVKNSSLKILPEAQNYTGKKLSYILADIFYYGCFLDQLYQGIKNKKHYINTRKINAMNIIKNIIDHTKCKSSGSRWPIPVILNKLTQREVKETYILSYFMNKNKRILWNSPEEYKKFNMNIKNNKRMVKKNSYE